jgi:hypothetical protein
VLAAFAGFLTAFAAFLLLFVLFLVLFLHLLLAAATRLGSQRFQRLQDLLLLTGQLLLLLLLALALPFCIKAWCCCLPVSPPHERFC